MKPIIGITPSPSDDTFDHGTFHRYALSATYTEAIEVAGGVPIILPPHGAGVEEILEIVDGLLLSGGGDVRPERYGDATTHPKTYGVHDLRDRFELDLLRAALERDLPILCICRGIQVLNVALGGTLIQDIADQYGRAVEHRQQVREIAHWEPSHSVTLAPESLAARVYGAEALQVNSFHHQAIKDLAADLRVAGTAPDGIVEAVAHPTRAWVLGLQWHPEMMFKAHPRQLAPFAGLVAAAREASRAACRSLAATD